MPGRLITNNALIAMEIFHSMKYHPRSENGAIAMKLDMSKAYDIMEWGFLRKLYITDYGFRWELGRSYHGLRFYCLLLFHHQ